MQQYKLDLVESKSESINGLAALLVTADQKQEQGTIRVLASLIQFENNIYNLMGISEISRFTDYQSTFLSTIRSFQELKEAEKLNRKPDVVRIVTVPQQMSLEAALKHFNMPESRNVELAILNGLLLTDQLEKGMLIKVVGK